MPFPIKLGKQSGGLASTIGLVDQKTERAFTGVSGTVVVHNFERDKDLGYGLNSNIASYTMSLEG